MTGHTTRALLAGTLALGLIIAASVPASGALPGARPGRAGVHGAAAWDDGGPLAATPRDVCDPGDDAFAGVGVTSATLPFTADRNLAWGGDVDALDVDHYALELTGGTTYRITARGIDTGAGPADPMIDVGWVPDPVGAPDLLESYLELDDSRTGTTTADAYFTAPHTGTYHVWVQDGAGGRYYNFGGSYRIGLSEVGAIAPGSVERIDGLAGYGVSDRYSVAAALAEKVAGTTQPRSIIIASGLDRAAADALTAGSLSGALNAPILLVRGDWAAARRLPQATATYLSRLQSAPAAKPIDFVIVGGPASVPEALKGLILSRAPARSRFVARYGGPDRYAVAVNVAARVRSIAGASRVFITNGQIPAYFYDSLAVSALSAKMRCPILLSKANVVPPVTLVEARRYGKKVLVGDDGALWSQAFSALGMRRDPVTGAVTGGEWIGYFRADANNLYDRAYMARLIAEYGEDHGMVSGPRIGLANKLMDALGGGAAIGRLGGTMAFTDADMMDPELTEGWLVTHRGTGTPVVTVAGGSASVRPEVVERAGFLVGQAP